MNQPRPFTITPALLRAARDRSRLSYLTMCDKLRCRSSVINDILCGNLNSGPIFMQFLDLMDPYWPADKRAKGESACTTKRLKLDVPSVAETSSEEEDVSVHDDDGNEVQVSSSVKFIPRSQGGGLDPNRPKAEKPVRDYLTRPLSAEAAENVLRGQDLDKALDPEADAGSEAEDHEPTSKELRAIEGPRKSGRFKTIKPPKPAFEPTTFPLHGLSAEEIGDAIGCTPLTIIKVANGELRQGFYVPHFRHFKNTGTFLRDLRNKETETPKEIPVPYEPMIAKLVVPPFTPPDIQEGYTKLDTPLIEPSSFSSDTKAPLLWADTDSIKSYAEFLTALSLRLTAVVEARATFERAVREYAEVQEIAKQHGITVPFRV